jgi:hypothetical protein
MTTRKYHSFASASYTFLLCAATLSIICPSARAETATLERDTSLVTQQFFCHTGYDPQQCQQHIAQLKAVLLQYPPASPKRWTWVIVRSEDWQPLLQNLHLPRQSPAFTALNLRETFLEDALFFPRPGRTDELVTLLKTPAAQLLSLAVSHELGHAICHNGNEAAANRVSEQLRSGKHPDCFVPVNRKPLDPIDEMVLHDQSSFPRVH